MPNGLEILLVDDDPDIQESLRIILENAGHGGAEAAPVAGDWLHAYFAERLPQATAEAGGATVQPAGAVAAAAPDADGENQQ